KHRCATSFGRRRAANPELGSLGPGTVLSWRQSPALLNDSLTTAIFSMTHLVFFCPGAGCLQRIAMLLACNPRFQSLFINRQVENARRSEQFPKRLHYLRCGGQDNFVHSFGLALGSVGIEINPLSVRAEDKHPLFWKRICWRDTCLRDEIRTALAGRSQVQNVSVPIIIRNRPHY